MISIVKNYWISCKNKKSINPDPVIFFLFLIFFLSFLYSSEIIEVILGGEVFRIEVADTDKKRERGLMYRKNLKKNDGMLFVFSRDVICDFWMRNTYVSLSIAFIDMKGRVTEIRNMEPYSLKVVTSNEPCKYALELRQGMYEEIGIRVGDIIDFLVDFN